MSGDYSRERFRADANVSGVRMQQGRVQLDSDWNEWVAVVDRRFRAETIDLVGGEPDEDVQGVAVYPRQTPDAFLIELDDGNVTIGRGRMYVDGLLAENHGAGTLEFDRVLEESRGTEATPYEEQPYFPDAPEAPAEGRALAYLDVWQREVTHLEDPGLVEPAVGVDTTTRMQTVWQVRLLPGVGDGVTCSTPDDDIEGWTEIVRPSAGRLTTASVGVPPEEDPCEMPPSGGYRGVENQLYRVEIHDGGGAGEATFKWSRDNGSVQSGVVEVLSAHELRLESLGRDSVLRFSTGDWVEIIDDHRELTGIGGDPAQRRGEIRQIVANEATRTITFTPDLPGDLVPSGTGEDTADARHLRVRRWDQSGTIFDADGNEYLDLEAAGDGVIPVPAATTTLRLEAGIEVTFSLAEAGGEFHTGDYWTFAARTVDASVEELDAAPPRGTHHHFARLGVLSFPDEVQDCRQPWPPEIPVGQGDGCGGCCTICISAEEFAVDPDILQEAVDQLRETGGTICLGAGTFVLGERTVRIHGARSITIKGQGSATQLMGWNRLFDVRMSFLINIEDMQIAQVQSLSRPAISLDLVLYGRYRRLTFVRAGEGTTPAIGMSRVVWQINVQDNVISSPVGIGTWFEGDDAQYLALDSLRVEDNAFTTPAGAVQLEGAVIFGADVRISQNRIAAASGNGITVVGASLPNARLEVTDNVISAARTGIVAGANGVRLDRNELIAPAGDNEQPLGEAGILLQPGFDKAPLGPVSVTANRVRNIAGPGIAVGAPLHTATIEDNVITGTAGGIIFAGAGGGDSITVAGNAVTTMHARREAGFAAGILVQAVRSASIAHNTVRGVDEEGGLAFQAGILTAGCLDVSVTHNHVSRIGGGSDNSTAVGILVGAPFARASVTENVVRADAVEPNEAARWSGILVGATQVGDVQPITDGLTAIRTTNNRTMLLSGNRAAAFEFEREEAAVHHNFVEGRGAMPILAVGVRGECMLGDNQCNRGPGRTPAVTVFADLAAVHSNRVRAGDLSMELTVDEKRSTVVGNITTSAIRISGNPLGAPWNTLNVTG